MFQGGYLLLECGYSLQHNHDWFVSSSGNAFYVHAVRICPLYKPSVQLQAQQGEPQTFPLRGAPHLIFLHCRQNLTGHPFLPGTSWHTILWQLSWLPSEETRLSIRLVTMSGRNAPLSLGSKHHLLQQKAEIIMFLVEGVSSL